MRSLATGNPAGRRLRLLAALVSALATIAALSLVPTAGARTGAPSVTLPPAGEVESVLGQTPLGSLTAGKLAEALSQAEGLEGVEGVEPGALQEALEKVIAELTGKGATLGELLKGGEGAAKLEEALDEVLGPLASKLNEVLGGNPRQKLEEALGGTPVGELIGKLLEGSPEPQDVIAQILQALGPERLQNLLGSVLSGEPFSAQTVEELADRLGTTAAALGAQFGKNAEQLPATAMALTAPLKDGDVLAAVKATEGVTLGVIHSSDETLGRTGGNGAPGSNGAPGASTTTTTTPAAAASTPKPAKVKVLSHKVKGATATIVLLVPSAGALSAGGKGVRSIKRQAAKSEKVTIHPSLTKAGISALRKHHRRYKVPVKVSFKPVGGAASAVTVPLTYR
jgi:hypothetical protein